MLRRNVLIYHTAALGDFVLTWPLALALGRVLAQSRIIYVTHGEKGRLAQKVLRVESSDVEAGWHGLFSDAPTLPEPAARLLAGAQWVFRFGGAVGDAFERNVATLAPAAQLATLQGRPGGDWTEHCSTFLLQQLSPHPVIHEAVRQMIRSIEQRGVGCGAMRQGPIVLHPGSGSPAKNWPLPCYVELAKRLGSEGRQVRFAIGDVERERFSVADQRMMESAGEVIRPDHCVDLAQVLQDASAVVVNDSGPGHLAGALGVATLSLFGPTDPNVWRPMGPHVQVVRHQPLDTLGVEDVYNRLATLLNRS